MIVGVESPAVILGPYFVGFLAQAQQQLGVVTGAAELHCIEPGNFVEIHEFVVGLDPGILGQRRHDPGYIAGNPGGTEVAQHADPLVALLNIEIAQVFKADNGFGDAGLAQVSSAEVDPFQAEFGIHFQQRLEFCVEGGNAAGGLGADDPFGGNLHHTQLLGHGGNILGQNVIQNGGVRGQVCHQAFPIHFLALFQSKQIFFSCGLNHSGLQITVIFCYYIIANFSNLCNRKLCRMVVSPVF